MKLTNLLAGAVVAVAMFAAPVRVAAVTAVPDTPTCKFINKPGEGWKTHGDTVSIDVVVVGDALCKKDFVVSSFKVPHDTLNPYPLEDQILFDYQAKKQVGPGTYKMTVKVPNCFHQVDLARGATPTGPNGHLPFEKGRMMNAYMAGTQKCVDKKPDKPVVPVTPVTPAAPTAPKTLPNTGPASVAAIVASVSAISAVAYNVVRRRHSA